MLFRFLSTHYHTKVGKWVLLALVIIHVLAIITYRLKKGQDLVTPMFTGNKVTGDGVAGSLDSTKSRFAAGLLLVACAGAVVTLVAWVA